MVMNRRQFLGAAALLATPAALSLAGCSGAGSDDKAAVAASSDGVAGFDGTFVVGFDQEFPPYGYVGNDGAFTGFDLDLAQTVCQREGWTFKPNPISWDAKDGLLSSGQITCIWNGFTIEGREGDYSFTDPYMENRQVVVTRADSQVTTLADLAGKNVVTQSDSAAYDLLSTDGAQAKLAASFAQLQTIGDYNTAFMMLESGAVDAIAVDYPVASFNIAGKKDSFKILDEALNSEHFGVGFAKTDAGQALADQVQKDLQALDAEGKVKELCEKYADQGVSYDLWVLPKA